jgi:HD-GYP domain-containing protein (c-di-GMP phosphodiesterase class II)
MNALLMLALGAVVVGFGATLWIRYRRIPATQDAEMEAIVRMIGRAMELRAPRYAAGTARVQQIADAITNHIGMDRVHRVRLRRAIWIRDLGLCDVPYVQLNRKPEFDWSGEEVTHFLQSGKRAADFLNQIESLRDLAPILSERHQAFEPGMTMEGRILRIASDFAWSEKHQGTLVARERLRAGAGKEYDPVLVEACLGTILENHVGTRNLESVGSSSR